MMPSHSTFNCAGTTNCPRGWMGWIHCDFTKAFAGSVSSKCQVKTLYLKIMTDSLMLDSSGGGIAMSIFTIYVISSWILMNFQ